MMDSSSNWWFQPIWIIRRSESAWLGNILCRIQTVSTDPNPNPKSKIQNPNSKIQNPKSKPPKSEIQTGPFGAATRRTKTKLIQNPNSKIQDPKSKIQNPKSKIQDPKSKIQNPKSKIQDPKSNIQTSKSKIQTARLEFGFWLRSGRDRGRWPCSRWRCMAVLATQIWPSWRHTSLQPKGSRLDSSHARPKLGTDFRWRGFAGNRGSISSPVSWKLGPNFRRNCKPGGVVRNVGLTSRGADHACQGKGCQHHVVFI